LESGDEGTHYASYHYIQKSVHTTIQAASDDGKCVTVEEDLECHVDWRSMCIAYTVTETALAEWDEGKPYSSAAEPDMEMRASGGDRGLGKQSMSFKKPVPYTPAASMKTVLCTSDVAPW
jgi:hypothetical protein